MNKKIFIIDDEKHVVELTKNILSKRGYLIETFENGEQALMALKDHRPDLIILDNLLPGENGYKICHEIKSQSPNKHIPVLLTTGQIQTDESFDEYENLIKPDDYLIKPFEIEDLIERVEKLLL